MVSEHHDALDNDVDAPLNLMCYSKSTVMRVCSGQPTDHVSWLPLHSQTIVVEVEVRQNPALAIRSPGSGEDTGKRQGKHQGKHQGKRVEHRDSERDIVLKGLFEEVLEPFPTLRCFKIFSVRVCTHPNLQLRGQGRRIHRTWFFNPEKSLNHVPRDSLSPAQSPTVRVLLDKFDAWPRAHTYIHTHTQPRPCARTHTRSSTYTPQAAKGMACHHVTKRMAFSGIVRYHRSITESQQQHKT